MSVQWKPSSSKAPIADYNDFAEWQMSNKYHQLIADQNNENANKIEKTTITHL